jgi:serine/threonine protein kinase
MALVRVELCQYCGNALALGAMACFRCGKMVEREVADTTGSGQLPTQLGTKAKGELLENQWRLIKQIGQGTAGVVWQGADVGLDRPVAVKLMHEHLVHDEVAVARFERESRVLATLEHPHIVPVLGVGKSGLRPFLVMKLLEGRSLAEQLHWRGGRLTLQEAVPLLSQLCEALDFVHGRGVLHRDLKPSNVFVGTDGQVWLLDLGLAHEPGSDLTRSGDVLGLVQYLSPEQLMGKRELDRRADVFSLGCLAFEIFSGQPPFTGEPGDVLAHQLHTLPPDVTSLVPELPRELGPLLRKALAKIPLERHSTAGDFAAALQRITGIAADGTSTKASGAAPLVMPRRNSRPEALRAVQEAPTRESQSEPTPQMREAQTAPSGPFVPIGEPGPTQALKARGPYIEDEATAPVEPIRREFQTAPSDPFAPIAPVEETRLVGDPREGPTGPTRAQVRRQLRIAALVLVPLAGVVVAAVALTFAERPPPPEPAAPLPPAANPGQVVEVKRIDEHIDDTLSLAPLPPAAPTIATVDYGNETLDASRGKRGRSARPKDSRGAPIVRVHVYTPAGTGRKEIKADLWLDATKIGKSPMSFAVEPGPHVVMASTDKFPMTDMEVDALPGQEYPIEITMVAPGGQPKPKPIEEEHRNKNAGPH